MEHVTTWVCGDAEGLEARWCWAMIGEQAAEQHALETREDTNERMAGRCDCCQEWPETGLVIDGGLAICNDCRQVT